MPIILYFENPAGAEMATMSFTNKESQAQRT